MASLLPSPSASTQGPSASEQTTTKEYVVRAPNDSKKKFSMIKFSSGTNIDFLKLTNTTVKMERENNLKEYKSVYNLEAMPKFGAGSEYGREQREEARRKKFGINIKKYNPNDQPWLMKVGKGKEAKRYKGVREGTITENTSYYIFTQCADGAFEAFPIEEWYNFQPVINYRYLNSEEAEEEFSKRDKTMNMFSIMLRKKIKNEEDTADVEEGEKQEKSKAGKKKDKNLILTDMEEWGFGSEDEDEDEEEDEDGDGDGEKKPKKEKKKKKDKPARRRKNAKINEQDEAIEESDEGDFDDRELDYISDSGSESSLDEKDKEEKYDDKGVDQEHGLKKLIDSEEESSEEEEEKKEEEEETEEPAAQEEDKSKKKKKEPKDGNDSDSSSSSSDSDDSDLDKNEDKFSSVLFMQKKKSASRSNTPTFDKSAEGKNEQKQESLKRKLDSESPGDAQKKVRTESPSASQSATSSGEITEEAIRKYLMRKPMTAKDLVQKFKSKKPQMSKEQMTQRIGQLLKKINPAKKKVKDILYLSLKK